MVHLNDEQLKNVSGGGLAGWLFVGITTFIAFASGFLSGYTRPLPCK